MISDRHKFIFSHTPRSGGSIFSNQYINTYRYVHDFMDEGYPEKVALQKAYILLGNIPDGHYSLRGKNKSVLTKHYLAKEYKDNFPDKWEAYFKFSVVRNPWDHIVSMYFMRRTQPAFIKKDGTFLKFHEWCERWFKLDHENSFYDLYYFIDNEMVLDDVVRFENYNEEMDRVWKKLFNTEMPYAINKDDTKELWKERKLSDRPADYRDLYKGEGSKYINSVRGCYPKIIEYFGYDLEL